MEFNGKVIIITGASSGIGAGTAEYLAKLGATLVLVGRSLENLTEVSNKCNVGNSPKPLIIHTGELKFRLMHTARRNEMIIQTGF